MPDWPRLCESRTIQSGDPAGTVIRCGLRDRMLADVPVAVVFFYQRMPDPERLADGLARALRHVPVFGGRLRTRGDQLEIVCADAGVPMVVSDLDETLPEAIERVMLPSSGYVDHIDGPRERQGGHPLLTVRLGRLADGGAVLGCSWHHAVGDMHTFMLLLRAWSAYVEGVAPPDVCLVEDLDEYLDKTLPPEDSGRPAFRLPDPATAAELRREIDGALLLNRPTQIYFTDPEIGRMQAAYSAAAGRRLSRNDVLAGHLVSAVRGLDGDTAERKVTLAVNIRRRFDIPASIVGNLLDDLQVTCPGGAQPEAVAARIRAALDDFGGDQLSVRASWAFLEAIGQHRFADCFPIGFDPPNRAFVMTHWSRFGAYDISFGGQRPVLVSPTTSLPLPWMSWHVEGFNGDGSLVTVILPSKLSARLRRPDSAALLHRFREPDDRLPALAGAIRKLV